MKQTKKKNKDVQISIKMDPELRNQFMELAESMDRPAAQIIRELMRSFIACRQMPNAETLAAIESVENGDVKTYNNTTDLYHQLGI